MEQQDFLKELLDDLQILASGKSFDFLNDEEDLYTEDDLKVKYNPKKPF